MDKFQSNDRRQHRQAQRQANIQIAAQTGDRPTEKQIKNGKLNSARN